MTEKDPYIAEYQAFNYLLGLETILKYIDGIKEIRKANPGQEVSVDMILTFISHECTDAMQRADIEEVA